MRFRCRLQFLYLCFSPLASLKSFVFLSRLFFSLLMFRRWYCVKVIRFTTRYTQYSARVFFLHIPVRLNARAYLNTKAETEMMSHHKNYIIKLFAHDFKCIQPCEKKNHTIPCTRTLSTECF